MVAKHKVNLARKLRRDQTDAETLLWSKLRNRQLEGRKFRRQVSIEGFIVDFMCPDGKLIVELDGGHHANQALADARRTRELELCGYHVIRFWNIDVLTNIDGVLENIRSELSR
jgi:very-short-patch-repair endonuclease